MRKEGSSHKTPLEVARETDGSAANALLSQNCVVKMDCVVLSSLTMKTSSQP